MKTIIFCVNLLLITNCLFAQNATLEIAVSTFQTNPLSFTNDYNFDFENNVFSSNTLGYSLSGKRTQPIFIKNLNWVIGGRMGVHAYSFDLLISENFRSLGWGGYTSSSKEYQLLLVDIFTGFQYDFPIHERMKIGIETDLVFNYHLRSFIGYSESAGLDNGQTKELFAADMVVNENNKVIIAAQFGLSYQYAFKNSGLRFSAYTLMASKSVLEGSYQLIGDNETRTGTFSKDYSFGGLELGYFWNLGR
jgi:hypothetical protein